MTASSPVTMQDLVDGLIFTDNGGTEWGIVLDGSNYVIGDSADKFNPISISSDGLTITFGDYSTGGPTFTRFTFNA